MEQINMFECMMPNFKIKKPVRLIELFAGDGIYLDRPEQKRGTVQCGMVQTLKTQCNDIGIVEGKDKLRIRKLTPRECWRLMGFDDLDFDKASKVNSNSQLYKQAGNSIVVNVLEAVLRKLYE